MAAPTSEMIARGKVISPVHVGGTAGCGYWTESDSSGPRAWFHCDRPTTAGPALAQSPPCRSGTAWGSGPVGLGGPPSASAHDATRQPNKPHPLPSAGRGRGQVESATNSNQAAFFGWSAVPDFFASGLAGFTMRRAALYCA